MVCVCVSVCVCRWPLCASFNTCTGMCSRHRCSPSSHLPNDTYPVSFRCSPSHPGQGLRDKAGTVSRAGPDSSNGEDLKAISARHFLAPRTGSGMDM